MTELLLICAIGVLGVAFAVTVARWLLERPRGDEVLGGPASLINEGVALFLARQHALVLTLSGVVAAGVLVAYGIAYQLEAVPSGSARALGLWHALTAAVGAGAGVLAAWVASWIGRQAGVRVAAATTRSLDAALQIGIRAGAVSGVVAVAIGALALCLLLLIQYLYLGTTLPVVSEQDVALRIGECLPGFLLGAALSALLAQLGGGVFGKVADLGADVAGKLEASLAEDAADNPAAIADLVGDSVGDGTARPVALFAGTALASFAAMWAASLVFQSNPQLPSASAVVLYPLVSSAFGLLATWFGVMVVRTDDTELPISALGRGMLVASVLFAVGALGAAKWLLGEHWLAFGGAAALGAVWSVLQLYATQFYSEQRYRPVRTLAEAARGGPSLLALRGLVTAVEGALVQLMLLGVTLLAAWALGASTDLKHGGLLSLALAGCGVLGCTPYALAMDLLASAADAAGGIIEMTVATERPDVRARVRLLDAVGTTTKSYTKTLATAAGTLACFIVTATVLARGAHHAEPTTWGGASALIVVGAVAGLLVQLTFGWLVLRRIVAAARLLVNELRTQLGKPGVEPLVLPLHQQTPDQSPEPGSGALACVEICTRMALRGMLLPLVAGVGGPLFAGLVLRLVAAGDNVFASAEAVVALLVVATLAAGLSSLLMTNAAGAWDNAKKYIETGAHGGRFLLAQQRAASPASAGPDARIDNPTYVAAVIGDTIGDPLKGALAPAMQSLIATLVALVLVFLPLLTTTAP